jgi:hypothetical protein
VTTATIAHTVAKDEAVQAVQARLNKLHEEQARLRARHHALGVLLARRFDQRIPAPPEVANVSLPDAGREITEIDRQLHVLERRIDTEQAALTLADVKAQATILEAATPEYRRLVDARDRAKAILDKREADIQAFLTDLRRRGVFQPPPIAVVNV